VRDVQEFVEWVEWWWRWKALQRSTVAIRAAGKRRKAMTKVALSRSAPTKGEENALEE